MKKITALAFLKYYRNEVLRNKNILLLDTPTDYYLQECLLKVSHENEFILFEKNDFDRKFHPPLWEKYTTEGVKLISNKNIPNTITTQGWHDFRKKFGQGYYIFSYPIVSKDLKHILFYISYNCGERCGYGSLALYEQTTNGWRMVKKYCDGVN